MTEAIDTVIPPPVVIHAVPTDHALPEKSGVYNTKVMLARFVGMIDVPELYRSITEMEQLNHLPFPVHMLGHGRRLGKN